MGGRGALLEIGFVSYMLSKLPRKLRVLVGRMLFFAGSRGYFTKARICASFARVLPAFEVSAPAGHS